MLFRTTDEHEALRKKIREFAEAEVKPIAFKLDQNNEYPEEIVKGMADLGIMGIPYDTEYGGAGLDAISYAIAVEEMSRVDGGVGVILSAHTSLGAWPIAEFGTEEQKQKYLIPLAKGEKVGAYGLTEPNAGSDAGGTETTAVLDGDHYILNGNKIFITNAPNAEVYVVFAVTKKGVGTKGISAFIVEKGWEGFTYGDHYDKLGIRSSTTAELIFNNVKVPKENLLGKEGEGFKIAMKTLDGGRIGIASQALGIAQGAYEEALTYSKERIQFGKPIAAQQAIAFKLADMATKLDTARLMIYHAASLKTHHEPYGKEAAMAKMYASDIAHEVVNDALQIFGGSGYLKGMLVERAYRDAKITTIYEGTNEIQRVVIAASIIGKLSRDAKKEGKVETKKVAATGERKNIMIDEGSAEANVKALIEKLKADGIDLKSKVDLDAPINKADKVVAVGNGIGDEENMTMAKELAKAFGAAIGASRPIAEFAKYVSLDRYVGLSGQRFKGTLYVAAGISGAIQHLKGIAEAKTIVAINNDPSATIFENADYGIVGDIHEIGPMLIKALGEEK
ncbi:acyl-CoA dehydrogenase family protein [Peptoniphilus sp. KCTC 25270]|uniref:acyl-CoA dehydrogenase family protein n=1 Tax=Peptoniphilus sp. KCTC 25270 TaxID=2897414 RepID=UPI001E5EFA4C|nr:acyl-CoA dehydrogenase family protein [Peptoniphilus sp. KCTC 25270]MCD1147567.1 acyl-CoA dehydrogenase family protein [Peptoniphilus sp. KCTC 25270]